MAIMNATTEEKCEVIPKSFDLTIRHTKGSYDHHHTFIHTISGGMLPGCIKRVNPCDQQVGFLTLFTLRSANMC